MSQHHGIPATYRHCKHCGRQFKVCRSQARRRAAKFCSTSCFGAAWRKWSESYDGTAANQIHEAA